MHATDAIYVVSGFYAAVGVLISVYHLVMLKQHKASLPVLDRCRFVLEFWAILCHEDA